MQETVEEYKKRIAGHLGNQKPLQVQAATAKKIEKLIKGVPRSKLGRRPQPNKWSAVEIIAHLGETEMVVGYRMRMILSKPGTPIEAYDQDRWAESGKYSKRDAKKELDLFRAIREANLALLKSLDVGQWKHFGMHAERGEETIERIAAMLAGHDLNHLKQIERILAKPPR
jgi:hypothetical protein